MSPNSLTRSVVLAAVLGACGGAQSEGTITTSVCPRAGTMVSFAQLIGHARRLASCEVTTEVAFYAVGTGPTGGFNRQGFTDIRVTFPGRVVTPDVVCMNDPNFALVPDDLVSPIFAARPGARLRLTGHIEYTPSGNALSGNTFDPGAGGRPFVVSSLTVVPGTAPDAPTTNPATSSRGTQP